LRKLGAVEGIEYSKLARDFSQKNHPEKVVAGDLNTFKLQAKKYDVICILDVLYHQNIRDDKKVIKRAADGLKTNGYLLITDCAHQWLYGPHDKENMARQRYSKKELEEKVENAGLQIVRSSYVFCFTFPLFVFVRLKQKIFDKDDQSESQNDVLNKIFAFVGKLEARLLRFFPLPFGSSILILAQKKSLT
jgi:SAM-dependent methyltransferase